jgi:RNA polymerase sigma factor (sigma-70 family)
MSQQTKGPSYEQLRPQLFSIAYRMLGTVADAEDVVQEAFLRLEQTRGEGTRIGSQRAFLTTVTTRLAIDELRSARVRRESYLGPWLPEPLITAVEPDTAEVSQLADSLSLSFLVLLETLTPVERAVFLLREVSTIPTTRSARSSTRARPTAARSSSAPAGGSTRENPGSRSTESNSANSRRASWMRSRTATSTS